MSATRRALGALLALVTTLAVVPTALAYPARSAESDAPDRTASPEATSELEVVKVTPLEEWAATSGGSIADATVLSEHFTTGDSWTAEPNTPQNEWDLTPVRYWSSPFSAGVSDAVVSRSDCIEYNNPLDLGRITVYQLRFMLWVDINDAGYDRLQVQVKVGAAGTWGAVTGADWSESDPNWRYETVDLSAYAGKPAVYLRFRFFSDGVIAGGDAYIDDIALVELDRVKRVAADSRYSTAVEAARAGFDEDQNPVNGTQWGGIEDIVIASGEDRAAADPLAAAALCHRYRAPLFLVPSTYVPVEVENAVKEIDSQTGDPIHVHIVGGTSSMPDDRFDELDDAVGGGLVDDRILATGNRYDLAAAIALRTATSFEGGKPPVVLIANGADPTKFFDALALSPITAFRGFPILLVKPNEIPSATKAALTVLNPTNKVIGGGPNTVSAAVQAQLGSGTHRWWGLTRYSTATRIAESAILNDWLGKKVCGVAAKLPDALTGGSAIGHIGGTLVLTDGSELTDVTQTWLGTHKTTVLRCFVFGGGNSVAGGVIEDIGDALR